MSKVITIYCSKFYPAAIRVRHDVYVGRFPARGMAKAAYEQCVAQRITVTESDSISEAIDRVEQRDSESATGS
jgi:hypothetical protein